MSDVANVEEAEDGSRVTYKGVTVELAMSVNDARTWATSFEEAVDRDPDLEAINVWLGGHAAAGFATKVHPPKKAAPKKAAKKT